MPPKLYAAALRAAKMDGATQEPAAGIRDLSEQLRLLRATIAGQSTRIQDLEAIVEKVLSTVADLKRQQRS